MSSSSSPNVPLASERFASSATIKSQKSCWENKQRPDIYDIKLNCAYYSLKDPNMKPPWIEDHKLHPENFNYFYYKEYPCMISLSRMYNTWNGYVIIPSQLTTDVELAILAAKAEVNGGISYTDQISKTETIIGFDTGHGGIDTIPPNIVQINGPVMQHFGALENYKTLEYVQSKIKNIIDSLPQQ